ncbi:MAG: FtsX-like permease family protein [Chloroflexi bacterium]|nr:FtsX-like permease family protein [Chloroflexota bacterium]
MNVFESMRVALYSLSANRLRSALTMLGIIIGVGAVIALLSIGQGAGAAITEQVQGIGSNLIIVIPGAAPRPGSSVTVAGTLTLADAEALEDRARCPAVAIVAPIYQRNTQVSNGSTNINTQVSGVTPAFQIIRNWQVASGNFVDERDRQTVARVAVLGNATAKTLFGSENPIGKSIKINRIPFRVVGVMTEKGGTSMFGGNQDDVVFVPLSTAQRRLFGSAAQTAQGALRVSSVLISATNEKQIDAAMVQITQVLRERHKIRYQQDDFTVLSQKDLLGALNQITDILTIFLAAIAAISLLVGGIGIMNIMLVSVTERTREIGIRKAIGARRRDIMIQFLIEAITMSVAGGSVGILFGAAVGMAVNATGVIKTTLDPVSVLLAVGFSVAVGLFFGLYPAARAASLHPIEALRYE